jgi:hypothetical protein
MLIKSITVILLVGVLSQPVQASPLAYDGFELSFPIYSNSGTGFTGPWVQGGFNAFASRYLLQPKSLCFPGLKGGVGGSVSAQPSQNPINGAIRGLGQTFGPGSTFYVSFLIQPQGVLNEGIFNGFFGLTLNGSTGNDLFIGKPGGPDQ